METVFLNVLNMSAAGSVVIGLVLLLRLFLRRVPRKWSYLLWTAVAFRLACPVSIRSVFSLFTPVSRVLPASVYGEHWENAGQISAMDFFPAVTTPAQTTAADITAVPDLALPTQTAATPDLVHIAAVLWLVGVAALLIYGCIAFWRTRRSLSTAFHMEGNLWQAEAIRSPFILGLFRPRIYIPFGLEGEELRFVLAHERYHIQHGDHLIRAFAFLLMAVHWFNPLCWLAFALCGRDMEMRCDEAVLDSQKVNRKAYSRTLLSFADERRFPRPIPLAFGEASVKSRIQNALNWKRPKTWVTILAAVVCLFAVAACAANPAPAGDTAENFDGSTDVQSGGNSETPPDENTLPVESSETNGNEGKIDVSTDALTRLKSYPDNYAELMEREDIVIETLDERFVNGQLWEDFWNSVQHGQSAEVVVCQFTVEGDPILQFVSYDGNQFHYIMDMSRDKFGGGQQYVRDDYRFLQRLELDGTAQFVLTDEEFTGPSEFQTWMERDYVPENTKLPRIVLSVWQRPLSSQQPTDILPTEDDLASDQWGITLTAKDVTPTGLTLVCTQSGGTVRGELLTGEEFVVERMTDGEVLTAYTKVPYIGEGVVAWNAVGIIVPLNDTREFAVDWSRIYGELPSGQYRIGKRFLDVAEPGDYDSYTFYARFSIE